MYADRTRGNYFYGQSVIIPVITTVSSRAVIGHLVGNGGGWAGASRNMRAVGLHGHGFPRSLVEKKKKFPISHRGGNALRTEDIVHCSCVFSLPN